jgi:hypothetical protein
MIATLKLSLTGFLLVSAAAAALSLPPCSEIAVVAGSKAELKVANGYGKFLIRKSGDGVVVSRDGKLVEKARVQRDGKIVRVQEGAETLLQIGVFQGFNGGQLAYTPDLDPASVKSRFGVEVGSLGDELAQHLGLDPDKALAISEVCDGPSTAKLKAGDVIVAVDGHQPVSEAILQKAGGAMKPGEVLRLTILRGGRSEEVSLAAGPEKPRPTAQALETYLRQAVNE